MVLVTPGLTPIRDFLTQHGAGFMRNVRAVPGECCLRCYGMVSSGWQTCFPCGKVYGGRGVDRLGVLAYGIKGGQSGTVMHAYKGAAQSPTAVTTIRSMLAYAIAAHQPCFTVPTYGPPTAWATVPSLSGRVGAHPLHTMMDEFLGLIWPEAGLAGVNPLVSDARKFHPGNFRTIRPVSGHVILVDDTWTTGGHVESAAAALKAGGASYVTALVVARWIEPHWENTQSFINTRLTADYDPDICPFTTEYC